MAVDPFIEAAFGPPPDGVDLTESQATKNNAIVIVLLVIAALSVAGRLVARSKYGPGLSLDDYAIVVAWVLVAATAGMVIAIGQAGAGRHVWALSLLYIYSFVFCTAVLSTKISILLFYWRVFMGNLLSFRFSIWIGAFLVGSYPIYFMITMGFCCNPLSHYWTQFKGTTGTCLDVGHFFFILAIINLITDVILLVIPVPEIFKLQMSKDKKIAVCGILGLGGFVCIASAVRVHYLKVFSTATDITWMMGPVAIWSSVEPSVGIFSACLPSFKPLLRAIRGRNMASSSSGDKGSIYPLGSKGPRSTRPRLRLDDEIALQSQAVGGEGSGSVHSENGSEFGSHIRVKTDIKQTINGYS
ncbi:Satratoxin biosynthesis SC1 cluster protein 4 [Colletotrichum siamense]|uniref:Satratoxin biosynthesis SC1 cluster protein 4 n=1 Tax=Colletotrichum siamense TaxID=690259 RepID=A0A9P5EUT8_COLSI|nr:Satratoxin biosynthesis SC1 cluster protein 4 [Colletotrichum siamense]